MASSLSTVLSHYPWFFVHNYLSLVLPLPKHDEKAKKIGRNALIGFCSSAASDVISNPIRVIKIYKQTNPEELSYRETVRRIVREDGVLRGVFGRGLPTKLIANGLQGVMFSVLWKLFDEEFF